MHSYCLRTSQWNVNSSTLKVSWCDLIECMSGSAALNQCEKQGLVETNQIQSSKGQTESNVASEEYWQASSTLRGWATWVRDLPLVVWGPGRQAGTWAVWRRRAAGRICWWTLLPPDLTETTCTGHYMPRVSLPATKKNNAPQQNDDKVKHTDMLIKRLKSEPQSCLCSTALLLIRRGPDRSMKQTWSIQVSNNWIA